ncbi:MAG: hypothetical protein WBX50_04965, partial [Candidatus Deferrimicrobiaceae bacterium]
RTAALYLTASPSCGCCALNLGPEAMRGVPQSGLWSESPALASGTGSERSKVASVADADAPRDPGSPVAI